MSIITGMSTGRLLAYMQELGLWDEELLAKHCDEHGVTMRRHPEAEELVILAYGKRINSIGWSEFSLTCRGLILDMQFREVVAHPFNKFFNLGEELAPSESHFAKLEDEGYNVIEKLDGSLGIGYFHHKTGMAVASRSSFESEHAIWATEWVNSDRTALREGLFNTDLTPIFEIIAPQFRNVIDYSGRPEGLYLIGMRYTDDLCVSYQGLLDATAEVCGFYRPKHHRSNLLPSSIAQEARALPGDQEGYVLQSREHMVKVKGEEYLRLHRVRHQLSDKNILEALRDGIEVAGWVQGLPEEYASDVMRTAIAYVKDAMSIRRQILDIYSHRPLGVDRAGFAKWVHSEVPQKLWPFMFRLYDGKELTMSETYAWMLKYNDFDQEGNE